MHDHRARDPPKVKSSTLIRKAAKVHIGPYLANRFKNEKVGVGN